MKTFIALTSKEHLPLAKAELETLLDVSLTTLKEGVYQFSLSDQLPTELTRLAFTKQILQVYAVGSKDLIEQHDFSFITSSYKILAYVDGKYSTTKEKSYADYVHAKQPDAEVNLTNPCHTYVFALVEHKLFLTEEIFANTDAVALRKAHLRKWNHPTSINPKFAKAMINLANESSFHDPFCGAGGLLIEGALMNMSVSGSDIDVIMTRRATQNLSSLGFDVVVSVQDALNLEGSYKAIITDLPFGKNSRLEMDALVLLERFLNHASMLTKKLVIGIQQQSPRIIESIIEKTPWILEKKFSFYIHKSMSREILLLTMAD